MRRVFLIMLLLLTACASPGNGSFVSYLARKGVQPPALDAIPHCRGYNCRIVSYERLDDESWQQLRALFAGVTDPASERAACAGLTYNPRNGSAAASGP